MTTAPGIKRLGCAVTAVILLGIAAIAAMSLSISDERVRESAKAEIRNVTGLELTLRGDSTVSLFPTGSVSFSDVVLGEDGTHEPALSADRLILRLRLLPLFIGRIEIADVALEQPRINVTFGPDGRSNWSDLIASLARALGPKGNRANRETSLSEIRVRNGTVKMSDIARNVTEALTGMDLALAWPSITKSFAATGRVVWRGEPLEVSISMSDFPFALAGERTGLKVRLGGSPLKFAFEGSMSARPTLKIDGSLSAVSELLRNVLLWAGKKPLPGGGFGQFALKANTSIANGAISLSGVNVELDGNAAEGALTFITDERKVLQGTLAADEIDLSPYVSTVQLVTANARDWNELPISLDGLFGFDFDLRLSAMGIKIGRSKVGRTAIAANLRGGKLSLTIGEARAFGGEIKGFMSLAATDVGADVKSQLQFNNVDLESSLNELFQVQRIRGRGNLTFAIETSGDSVRAFTQNLNGSISLNGQDGEVLGVNAERELARLMGRPLSGPVDFRSRGRTPYERLLLSLNIKQGIATVDEARLDNPKVRIAIAGTSSIPIRELDLLGQACLFTNRTDDTPPTFSLAFGVTGSWDEPWPTIDRGLIKRSQSALPLLDGNRKRNERDTAETATNQTPTSACNPHQKIRIAD